MRGKRLLIIALLLSVLVLSVLLQGAGDSRHMVVEW